jgi:hypothetical protein
MSSRGNLQKRAAWGWQGVFQQLEQQALSRQRVIVRTSGRIANRQVAPFRIADRTF